MNARFDPVIRDDNHRAAEDGEASRRAIAREEISQSVGNEIHAFISRKYGVKLWGANLHGLADDVAKAELNFSLIGGSKNVS